MKLEELTDISINEPKTKIVIELPNGDKASVKGNYYFDRNGWGEPILVIKTGRKL